MTVRFTLYAATGESWYQPTAGRDEWWSVEDTQPGFQQGLTRREVEALCGLCIEVQEPEAA